jgi:hypothetical protein
MSATSSQCNADGFADMFHMHSIAPLPLGLLLALEMVTIGM